MIPEYLHPVAWKIREKGCRTTFDIICHCGENKFWLYSNFFTPEEERQMKPHDEAMKKLTSGFWGYEIHRDKEGNFHYYKTVFPFFKKEIPVPEAPAFAEVTCWMAECSKCGKRYLLFDNRYHGYDGVFCRQEEILDYDPHFRKEKMAETLPVKLEVEVAYDPSPEQMREEIGEVDDVSVFSNAFSWICVRYIDKQGKRKIVLDYETA